MIKFETRNGPSFPDNPPRYPEAAVPAWYRDAKLGIFIHWGLYSVPAYAIPHPPDSVPPEDSYRYHRDAAWYANTMRIAGSPTGRRHEQTYGVGTRYEDLADHWHAERFDAKAFLDVLVGEFGARYIVPTTKHHDGFCLWDTETSPFNAARRGPRRDLICELHDAARAADICFGVYFSGALDWHVSDFAPIESDAELFRLRRNDVNFARYATAQLTELIDRFRPDLLWNDIEWPDAGKGADEEGLAALLRHYFDVVPAGVVNDRWGVPYHGFLTREYTDVTSTLQTPWEATRGFGYSFGYNQSEEPEHSLSGVELVRYLVDVVSKNGNLLINVGPRHDGSIPEIQGAALRTLGSWLAVNGPAIFGTRPWVRSHQAGAAPLSFTAHDGIVYAHALRPKTGWLELPAELSGRDTRWLGADDTPHRAADRIAVPDVLRAQPVAVLACAP